jgi:toxin ParE1/3/4
MAYYRLSKNAKRDLSRIFRRGLTEFGESQATKYYDSLFECFDRLEAFPLLGTPADNIESGLRRFSTGVDSIYYRVEGDEVYIVRIIGAQSLENWVTESE